MMKDLSRKTTALQLVALSGIVTLIGASLFVVLAREEQQTAQAAQADYFLKIEGIDRNSPPTIIEIQSWSWGATNSGSAGKMVNSTKGLGTGKASFQDLTVTKLIDKSTPILYNALDRGTVIPQITLLMPADMDGDGVSDETIEARFINTTIIDILSFSWGISNTRVTEPCAGTPEDCDDSPSEQVVLRYSALSVNGILLPAVRK